MTFRRRSLRRTRAALVLALCVSLSASAAAFGDSHEGTSASIVGDSPADFTQPVASAPIVGDSPADFAQPVAQAALPGDIPADHPGVPGAPNSDTPATIQVVRPERTIVRDVDAALPTILASLALLVALGGTGFAVMRTRPGTLGRTH